MLKIDEIIIEIYNKIKDYCLSIQTTGSRVLPYLKSNNDIDIVFIYDTWSHCLSAKNKLKRNFNQFILRNTYNLDIHFISLDKPLYTYYWCYVLNYSKPLLNFKKVLDINILDYRDEYLQTLRYFVSNNKKKLVLNIKLKPDIISILGYVY